MSSAKEAPALPAHAHTAVTGWERELSMIASSDLINPIPKNQRNGGKTTYRATGRPRWQAASDLACSVGKQHTVDFLFISVRDAGHTGNGRHRGVVFVPGGVMVIRRDLKVSRTVRRFPRERGIQPSVASAPAASISIAKNELAVLGTISLDVTKR